MSFGRSPLAARIDRRVVAVLVVLVLALVAGMLETLLPDDRQGSRHQRFIVELDDGHTLLLSHNIDLAPRIDSLAVGDTVRFRGEFEHNERGGVIHWTHDDPQRRSGGWIEHRGNRYR